RDGITQAMRSAMVPVTIKLTADMEFTGFEIRGKVADGDAEPLELQVGYEVLGSSSAADFPPKPAAKEVTAITDQKAADKFWEDFNARDPGN
ncbi:hypothetical protein, partial [Actinophytocola sp.]|uniref:hypothetical protein n=1 Tax=Actinophytocola sp. TaxID=1872138 RepID=UPI002ED91466